MTNQDTLTLAYTVMKAHNDLTNWETFRNIEFAYKDEYIKFDAEDFTIATISAVIELLNLTLHITIEEGKIRYKIT